MDEKQTKLGLKACAITIVITYIYLLIATFYKFLTTNDIENCAWEIGLLVLIPFIIIFVWMRNEKILLPKISDEELKAELAITSKKERIKNYLINSIGFSFGMICISFIIAIIGNMPLDFLFEAIGVSNMADVVLKCFIEFAVLIVISFLLNYGYGEYKIRSYKNA